MNLIGELKTRSQKSTSVISSTFSEFSDGRFSRSWLSRLLRAYDLVVSFEIVPQIKDVERLCILARLPDEIKETAMISGKFHFFGESISIRNSKRNDLSQIVSALAQSGDASNFYRKKKYLEAIAKIEQAKKLLEKYESTRAISEELQFLVRDLEEKI